jgi:hypothetical protein
MLSDLVFVLKHIKKIVDEYNLVDLYTNFANTLQSISQSSTEDLQTALKDYKQQILKAHKLLEPNGWSYSQTQVFKKFGAESVLGNNGLNKFIKALADNSANVPGVVGELNKQKEAIQKIRDNTNNILSSLDALAEELEVEEGQSVIQIVFDENVAVETIPDLFEQSKEWKEIIRAYSLFAGEAPEKTTIIAASKGSPYTLWLKTAQFVGETLCATIKPFVDLYKEILIAREKAITLEDMKVGVDGKKFELFKTIDEYERKRLGEIIEDVAKIKNNKDLTDGEKNEAVTALLKAGPRLYGFITNGGKVDVSKNDGNKKVFSNFQLQAQYSEVHQLNDNVQKLLAARAESARKEEPKAAKEVKVPAKEVKKPRDKKKKEG